MNPEALVYKRKNTETNFNFQNGQLPSFDIKVVHQDTNSMFKDCDVATDTTEYGKKLEDIVLPRNTLEVLRMFGHVPADKLLGLKRAAPDPEVE